MSLTWRPHPILKPPTDEEMSRMDAEQLVSLHAVYHDSIESAEKDPYRYGFHLPHWDEANELLKQYNEVLCLGGNRCLAGEQEIYDPVQKKNLRVDSITEEFHVNAWDWEAMRPVVAPASRPFAKPVDNLFRVELENGESFACSAAHRVLVPDGWRSIAWLGLGGVVSLPASTGTFRASFFGRLLSFAAYLLPSSWARYLSVLRGDVLRLTRTVQDSLGGCPSCHHFYDAQFRLGANGVQWPSPSLADAPEHRGYVFCDEDGRANTPQGSRFYSESYPLSSPYALNRCAARIAGVVFQGLCSVLKPLPLKSGARFWRGWSLLFPEGSLRQRLGCGVLRLLSGALDFAGSCLILPHESRLIRVYHKRADVVWDISVEPHLNYFIGGVLHKNSGKTTYAARAIVRSAIENPGSTIMCFAQNADVSIRQQQAAVFDALPEEFRRKVLGQEANVSYTRKNGFSKGSLILPGSRSHIIFKTYTQFLNNDTVLEGAELGSKEPRWINIGAWCDEYLIGPELLATLRFRLATRNAKMIVTFTPIDGWTETVRDYIDGARTIKVKEAELLDNRRVPFIQHSKNRNAGIVYFHSKDNPFGGYERIALDLRGRPEDEILVRAYGIPTKSVGGRFPLFSREVNVVKPEAVPVSGVTRYMILDPAGSKSWFMAWVAVDATGTYWVYREWPDVAVGDWAEFRNGKWGPGDGARGKGYGIRDYVDLILRFENGEQIFDRLIDPRLGAAKYQTQTGASSIIEELAEAGMVFNAAPGLDIEDGIQALQSKMAYNRKQPIDGANRPHFYVSESCENIIHALQEYTGEGGSEEIFKDPVDVLRYAAIDGIRYIEPRAMNTTKRRGGY